MLLAVCGKTEKFSHFSLTSAVPAMYSIIGGALDAALGLAHYAATSLGTRIRL
jgi:hypothetical protein